MRVRFVYIFWHQFLTAHIDKPEFKQKLHSETLHWLKKIGIPLQNWATEKQVKNSQRQRKRESALYYRKICLPKRNREQKRNMWIILKYIQHSGIVQFFFFLWCFVHCTQNLNLWINEQCKCFFILHPFDSHTINAWFAFFSLWYCRIFCSKYINSNYDHK